MFAALNSFLTRAVSAGYFLNKSLRFRSSASAYLNRTPATSTNQTTWTWSGWVKRGTLGQTYRNLFGITNAGNDSNYLGICFGANGIADNLGFQGWNTVYRATTAVYRDPAAWYHIVVAVDTTQATAANRILMYVNGDQITSFSSNTNPTQNATLIINSAVAHQISQDIANGGYYDGEMAEINFVDGQALAPTAFGASSTYNQWLPIRYAGTYGTNGFYLPFTGSASATTYAGSFNGSSQYLTVPDNAAFTLGTNDFTIECWVNFTTLANSPVFSAQMNSAASVLSFSFTMNTTGRLTTAVQDSSSAYKTINSTVGAILIDTWYHVALVRDGNTNRQYINGVQTGSVSVTGFTVRDSTDVLGIGCGGAYNASQLMTGYISNFRLVNGTCLYPSGTTFTPPTAPLTAVTNTALLTLQNATIVDNSTNAFTITNTGTVVTSVQSPFLNPTVLIADSSGNANNWTPNNISLTAGSTYDSLTDVPTLTSTTVANYAVLNPLQKHDAGYTVALTNGNLSVTITYVSGVNMITVPSTVKTPTSGKWYWEITVKSTLAGAASGVGVITPDSYIESTTPPTDNYLYVQNGNKYTNGTGTAYGSSYTNGDVIGVALDVGAGTITFYKNNTSQGTAFTGLAATTYYAVVTLNDTGSYAANFGQQPFTYTAPSGFLPLNTFNI